MASALFKHMYALYDLLYREAEGDTFTGSQRVVFDQLGLSPAYNSQLYRGLREMGCIEQVQRGAGKVPSILKLVHPPQIEQFNDWNRTAESARPLTRAATLRSVEAELRLLERRLPQGVSLPEWIVAIEGRLASLEAAIQGKERDGTKA